MTLKMLAREDQVLAVLHEYGPSMTNIIASYFTDGTADYWSTYRARGLVYPALIRLELKNLVTRDRSKNPHVWRAIHPPTQLDEFAEVDVS